MDNSAAAAEALEAIGASALALAAELRRTADPASAAEDPLPDPVDPLGQQATAFLDGLSGLAGMEARMAAVKVHLASGYAAAEAAKAPPVESPADRTVRQMSVTAEVAG